jgi:hypothetical protein
MAGLLGSGRERPSDDESIGNYIYASKAKTGVNSVASVRLSESAKGADLTPDFRTIYLRRYARAYEVLRRAGSSETVGSYEGVVLQRAGFANQVIDQQRTLEGFGLGNTAEKTRVAIDRRLVSQ